MHMKYGKRRKIKHYSTFIIDWNDGKAITTSTIINTIYLPMDIAILKIISIFVD